MEKELVLANDEAEYIAAIQAALKADKQVIEQAARERVISRYNWDANLQQVDTLLNAKSNT